MMDLSYDARHELLVFTEGSEVFDGEDEVFAFLTINLTQQRYGWQVHGARVGDRPPSSSTYSDSGFNSSCGSSEFGAGKQATLAYGNLMVLSGSLDCAKVAEGGSGVYMSWYFVPVF